MSESVVTHTLLGGKLHVYRRPGSRFWQCSAYEAGKNRRVRPEEGVQVDFEAALVAVHILPVPLALRDDLVFAFKLPGRLAKGPRRR